MEKFTANIIKTFNSIRLYDYLTCWSNISSTLRTKFSLVNKNLVGLTN